MSTIKGPEKSVDGGKFQVIVTGITYTADAIKFKVKPKITNSFSHSHQIKLQYLGANGKWITYATTISVKTTSDTFSGGKVLSVKSARTQVRAVVKNVASTVTLTSNVKPAKPSKVSYKYLNDSDIELSFTTGSKGSSVPNNTLHIYRKEDTELAEWREIGNKALGGVTGKKLVIAHDQDASQGHRYKYGASVENQAGSSGIAYGSDWIYTSPSPVSNVNVERVDDYTVNISFQVESAAIDRRTLTGATILRQANGTGAYEIINRIKITSRQAAETSLYEYTDKDSRPNNSYKYAIRARNDQRSAADMEPVTGTDTIYNTPGAPAYVRGTYTAEGNINVKIDNRDVNCAEKTVVERSIDNGATWEELGEITTTKAVNTYTDVAVPVGVDVIYRAANSRDDGEMMSPYTTMTAPVIVLIPPEPPTLLEPYNNAKLLLSEYIRFSWMHNPLDGTPQEKAKIWIKINGSTYDRPVINGRTSYYDFPTAGLNPGDVITWKTATKGGHADYSEYSEEYNLTVLEKPEIQVNEPENNFTITTLPVHLDFDYIDTAGELQDLKIKILQAGNEVYSEALDPGDVTETNHVYDLSGFLFENETNYDLQIIATSTTGLSNTVTISLYVNYESVQFASPWYPDIDVNEDTGIVTVTINDALEELEPDPDDETEYVDEQVVHGVLYRVTGQGREKIAESILAGEQFIDFYAPLNQPYTYELMLQSDQGKISIVTQESEVNTPYWYVYYGPNNENICKALWQPQGDVSLDRPEKTLVRYSGRKYPVSYDSSAMEETFSFSGKIIDREELNHFIAMIRNGGTGVWHSANGEAYDASFKFSYSADYTERVIRWDCKLDVTRIEA